MKNKYTFIQRSYFCQSAVDVLDMEEIYAGEIDTSSCIFTQSAYEYFAISIVSGEYENKFAIRCKSIVFVHIQVYFIC
jgi:hypothetical protein